MLDREIDPPDSYKRYEEEKAVSTKCACCLDPVDETFLLGIETFGHKPTDNVCSYCMDQLHNNLSLTN